MEEIKQYEALLDPLLVSNLCRSTESLVQNSD